LQPESTLQKNKVLIEERNNALTENTEQARKMISNLRDEKLSVEEKVLAAAESLSQTRNLSKLNHTNADLTEHLTSMKVKFGLNQ